jgi:hypothetical protein
MRPSALIVSGEASGERYGGSLVPILQEPPWTPRQEGSLDCISPVSEQGD